VAGGAGEDSLVLLRLVLLPSVEGFCAVVESAEWPEVSSIGGAAGGVGELVVEVGLADGVVAAGELAAQFTGLNQRAEFAGWPIAFVGDRRVCWRWMNV